MHMTSPERWMRAQEYEAGYWQAVAKDAAENSLGKIDFYDWRAGELVKRLRDLGLDESLRSESRVVELGPGPVGLLGFLPGQTRVSVDPLNDYYSQDPRLADQRAADVQYLTAPGEAVPLESAAWDFVIMENCIDHTRDPDAVLGEVWRLLKPNGTLYMTVNCRSRVGYYVHRLLARLSLDPGHPHTYTANRFRQLAKKGQFEIIWCHTESWTSAWLEDLRGPSLRVRAKAVLGVSEHLTSMICRKV